MYGIGIDLGYANCGLACIDLSARQIVNYMTIETARTKLLNDRLRLIHDAIRTQLSVKNIKAVGYEHPLRTAAGKAKRNQTSSSSLILHIVLGHIQSLCWTLGLQLEGFEPQEVKKAVMGSGGAMADKSQIRHMVKVLTGFAMNEHEADATATAFALTQRLTKLDLMARLNA